MNDETRDPIICPHCGGTGMHPWKQATCRYCHGTGEITEDICDTRYKLPVDRAHRGCLTISELFVCTEG